MGSGIFLVDLWSATVQLFILFHLQVMIIGLKLLQKLVVSHAAVGEALLPHYRQVSASN